MLLIVGHEESQLIAEAKERPHPSLISRDRKLRERRSTVGVRLHAFIRHHAPSKLQRIGNLEFGPRKSDVEVSTAVENFVETIFKSL